MSKGVLKEIFSSQSFYLFAVIMILCAFTASVNPKFMQMSNIMNVLEQISVLGLVAAGATVMIISGNFDISVGAIIGLSCCVMAKALNGGAPEGLLILIGLAVCTACTVFNGALSILLDAPSFIVTL
ncbi:MAG: hypothetical protein LBG12_10615, partial [Synergistaceae bacterium]|nr:hypothetical protein [Synergistaceae bacterium]